MNQTELGKTGKEMYRKIGLLLLIVCLFAIGAPSSYLKAGQTKNVLVLHSYHQGLGWTDRITQGIESALHSSDQEIKIHIEYMDTKRIYDTQYLQYLYELYRHKFRNRRFDVVMFSDNHAFNFLLSHHRELFPDTPIVFCGVNGFEDSMLLGHDPITGVAESLDYKSTIDVALQLQPNIEQVFVIVDKTLTGSIAEKLMKTVIPHFKDTLRFTFWKDLDMAQVQERAGKLTPDSIAYLITFTTDRSGNVFSLEQSCELISQYCAVPIYSSVDSYIGHGIIGGMLTSGYAQGEKAGEMALRILRGEKVENISVLKKSPNRYMFDYQQMQRFGIKLSSLPEGSTVINIPYSFYSEHKRLIWSVIAGIAGLILIILILSINIINRRRAERELRESEENYRSLVESTEDSIYLVDRSGTYMFVNEKYQSRLGSPVDKIIGKTYGELHSLDDTKEFLGKIEEVFETGQPIQHEHTSHRDGRSFLRTLSPVIGSDGKTRAITVDSKDITERVRSEEALGESEERYRTLFHDLADPVLIFRDEEPNTIRDCNKAIVEKYGYSREEVLKMIPQDFHPPDELERVIKNIQSEEFLPHEYIHIGKDGKKYFVEINSRKIKFKGEDAQLSIIRDITDRKQAEGEKKKLEAQLAQAQKMETIGILAGGVAHDLNNILSGIISYPELLLMDLPEGSPLRKPLLTIKSSGEKAAVVVQDLLTLARRGVISTEIVNLNSIISEQLKSPECENLKSFHSNIDIKTNLEKDLLNIKGSTAHLGKTVMNLTSNAAEAMPDGGKVLISTENLYIDRPIRGYDHVDEGDYVVVKVSDTGIGISKKDMNRIFEPFYTKKVMGRSGSGLGMSVVWGTVKDHNGYIDIESTKGKGTTFTLYFPVIRQELAIDKSLLSIEDYMGKGESILIVDDVEEQREIASVMLKKLGYSVTSVSSGEEAIEYMKDNSVDLLVLDMIMDPGIDGLDTYKKILELYPKQKAIIASGFSETDRVKEAKRLGAGAYVKKPYVLGKIGLVIKEELEK